MEGRKPKPPELKLLEGNRGHRPILPSPKPRADIPTAPRWILEIAKKEWRRVSKELYKLGLLTVIDKVALMAYCQCYARWKDAEMKSSPAILETEKGYEYQNPNISIALKYAKEMRTYIQEFGMTPSSRARLKMGGWEQQEFEEWEKLIAGSGNVR